MDLDNVFSGVQNAKALGSFTPNLVNGDHTVLVKRFNVKESQKGKGKIVEADFHIVDSTTDTVGSTKGWPWFIGAGGFQGEYAMSRLKDFMEAVQKCIGDTGPISETGKLLAGPQQAGRGLMLKCSVFNGKAKKDGNGYYQEIKWTAVPQTLEDIAKNRAKLDGSAAQETAAAQTATVTQTTTATPAAGTTSLLGGLKGLAK